MATALVTGAAGWLGQRLVRALAENDSERLIRALVLPGQRCDSLREAGAEVVEGDLTRPTSLTNLFDGEATRGATLFHCGGLIHPRLLTSDFYRVNVEGTRNVIAAAVASQARRMVHISSNSPLGNNPSHDHLFDEQSPYRPYRHYGRSKKHAEELVRDADSRGELETVILRPPWFYGPGQPPRQTQFFKMIQKGSFPILGDGRNRRSMAFVDNLCEGALCAEASEAAAGQTYWIADSRPYEMLEIIETVETVLEELGFEVTGKRLHLPGLVGEFAGAVDWGLQAMGLYHQKIHVLSEMNKTIACSVERAQQELGYQPSVALEEGMRRSVLWLIEKGEMSP